MNFKCKLCNNDLTKINDKLSRHEIKFKCLNCIHSIVYSGYSKCYVYINNDEITYDIVLLDDYHRTEVVANDCKFTSWNYYYYKKDIRFYDCKKIKLPYINYNDLKIENFTIEMFEKTLLFQ